jgi:hypothetical protein
MSRSPMLSTLKRVVCALLLLLPIETQDRAATLVRKVWPGFKGA